MKQLYTTLTLVILAAFTAQSRPVNTVTTWWGNWSAASNWSLGRVPHNGDSIVVPSGKGIVFDVAASYTNLDINVLGNLTIEAAMTLDNQSSVTLAGQAQINAWGASRTAEIIVIGGVHKFDQTNTARIWGAGLANNLSGVAPNGFSMTSLPVTFSSFYAVRSNNKVMLTWGTAQEINNNNFEIQRSLDGSNWKVIALVMGAGTTNTAMQYSYTDNNLAAAAVAYYRIRQVDFDGNYTYSIVKSVRSEETAPATKVYAANNAINVEFNKAIEGSFTVRLFNTNGQLLAQQSFSQAQYKLTMNTGGKGIFVVQVADSKGWTETTRVFL
ncbi:MAG: hypothetical protein JST39_05655 [Bacteroidetes bacterium]|nr:hypothetical protein [Bacteroidota bacterium]